MKRQQNSILLGLVTAPSNPNQRECLRAQGSIQILSEKGKTQADQHSAEKIAVFGSFDLELLSPEG